MIKDIVKLAKQKNEDLGYEYYSENTEDYKYVGNLYFKGTKIAFFNCSKSNSTVSIRFPMGKHELPPKDPEYSIQL